MNDNNCKKCGGILVFGKGTLATAWCPICEGIQLESIEESKKRLISGITENLKEMRSLMKKFNKESLLITVFITREAELHSAYPSYWTFIALSELLNEIVCSKEFGEKWVGWNSREIQELYSRAVVVNQYKKFISLLQNDWIRFIKIRKSELSKYCFDLEKSLSAEHKSLDQEYGDELLPNLKFTAQWSSIKENLSANGLLSLTEAYYGETDQATAPILDEFWISILTKILLECNTGDQELLEFPELKKSLDYLNVLEKIATDFPFDFSMKKNEYGKVIECKMHPVDISSVFYPFFKEGLDLKQLDNFITYTNSDKKNGFPIFLLTTKGLFIGQQTILVISRFLKAKYFREYLDRTKSIGKEFETQVVLELEKYGFMTSQPNDCTKKLTSIIDNEKNPTLEIDIVAYDKTNLYLLECKHVVLSTDFILHNREKIIKNKLRDEPEKMRRRIEFFSKNLEKYGFSHKLAKNIKPVFVTFNEEPLKNYEGIEVVPYRKLYKLSSIS